jgi:hypothetical protein
MNKFARFAKSWWDRTAHQHKHEGRPGSSADMQVAIENAVWLLAVYGLVHNLNENIIGLTTCVGPSMTPTIDENRQVVIVDRMSYKLPDNWRKDYERNDVVISLSMDNPRKSKSALLRLTVC